MLIFRPPKGDFHEPLDVRIEALFLAYRLGEEVARAQAVAIRYLAVLPVAAKSLPVLSRRPNNQRRYP